jgi:hypothetical protein
MRSIREKQAEITARIEDRARQIQALQEDGGTKSTKALQAQIEEIVPGETLVEGETN